MIAWHAGFAPAPATAGRPYKWKPCDEVATKVRVNPRKGYAPFDFWARASFVFARVGRTIINATMFKHLPHPANTRFGPYKNMRVPG